MFKELFIEAGKVIIQLGDDSTFLRYPKDIMLDLEDKYGFPVIEDYDIDYRTNKVDLYFTDKGRKIYKKAIKDIKNAKVKDV